VADWVKIGGISTHSDFDICSMQDTLVIWDIEGAKRELLDLEKAPELLQADILAESHECNDAGLTETLRQRFERTHDIETLGRAVERPALPAWMDRLSDLDRLIVQWEWRAGPTPWLWMRRKS
tara:strand:+ start:912 stop:1280 length:369 start_codon:yes stop_codon:yes gene_type:complete